MLKELFLWSILCQKVFLNFDLNKSILSFFQFFLTFKICIPHLLTRVLLRGRGELIIIKAIISNLRNENFDFFPLVLPSKTLHYFCILCISSAWNIFVNITITRNPSIHQYHIAISYINHTHLADDTFRSYIRSVESCTIV